VTFSPERYDAIRAGLIEAASQPAPTRRKATVVVTVVLVGVLVGGVAMAIGATSGWRGTPAVPAIPAGQPPPTPSGPDGQPTSSPTGPVEAPPGQVPGTAIVSFLGDPSTKKVTDEVKIPLKDRPEAATHVRVTLACLTAGTFHWGTDPTGNNPSVTCDKPDVDRPSYYDFPLGPGVTTLYVTSQSHGKAAITIQYLVVAPTKYGVNEHG